MRRAFVLVILLGIGFPPLRVLGQDQTCPVNINFSSGDLTQWSALTGLLGGAVQNYPAPNTGTAIIPEYTISATGIQVITTPGTDPFGGFPTIPVINGYAYKYSVKLGSTATSYNLQARTSNPGGFRRAITYTIQVPPGPATEPYTMTYAYALVLENGTHNSNEQPMFKATLTTSAGVIACASPEYYLPTLNNAGGGGGSPSTGATLDSAAALAEGFTVSPRLFLSHAGQRNNGGTLLQDVWTKGWTEVTFDLSPYRGQKVTLSFEADNCVPGAHFAYAYVALRDNCGNLMISGPGTACINAATTYSVPALAGATYQWTIPPGWTLNSGKSTNTIQVIPNASPGNVVVHEVNSCADLRDTLAVSVRPPTIAGRVLGDSTVCAGINSVPLSLQQYSGDILGWYASTDGVRWDSLGGNGMTFTAQNLNITTRYMALVQNGASCSIDTAQFATVTVDKRSDGGLLNPARISVCAGRQQGDILTLQRQTGDVQNWQMSADSVNWSNFMPAYRDTVYDVGEISSTTYYRAIVKSGVCPEDTSDAAVTVFISSHFPVASVSPLSASICYGDSIVLKGTVETGTAFSWIPGSSLKGVTQGTVISAPQSFQVMAKPEETVNYVLAVQNAGCPDTLRDTIPVAVSPPIVVSAGNDTLIAAGQPLQLNATVNDPNADIFSWQPATGLNFTDIADPVATLGEDIDTITYLVTAADAAGCYGTDSISVGVFKAGANIFVPTAFTPNGDGMNDLLRPICVGIRKLSYFRVYDRWGRLVFTTSRIGSGWDGTLNGKPQPTGGYVYMAAGVDYTGKPIFRKGSVLLIR